MDLKEEATLNTLLLEWQSEQLNYKKLLDKEDDPVLWRNDDKFPSLTYIGGVDISFPRENKDDLVHACASLVVISLLEKRVVYEDCEIVHLLNPYIPGYLGFREADLLSELILKSFRCSKECAPQVIMVDGNGILHPRGFGLGCHIGLKVNLPTIGVAKKLFHVDGLENNQEHKEKIKENLYERGTYFPLVGNSDTILGRAVRTTHKSENPVYISVGHKISLETATQLVVACSDYRIPEPVRQADQKSREYLRKNYACHVKSCKENWQELSERYLGLLQLSAKKTKIEHQEGASCEKEVKRN